MSKTEDKLRLDADSNENRAELGAVAVFVGLLLEVLFALARSLEYNLTPPAIENWGTVVADSLVTIGVAAEVLFSRKARRASDELTRRSEERVAEAYARAAEANQKAEEEMLARIKIEQRIAPRSLTEAQHRQIVKELSDLPGVRAAIGTAPSTTESELFARKWLGDALSEAGWTVEFGPGIAARIEHQIFPFGVLVRTTLDEAAVEAGTILARALNEAGIRAETFPALFDPSNPEATLRLLIVVGPKP